MIAGDSCPPLGKGKNTGLRGKHKIVMKVLQFAPWQSGAVSQELLQGSCSILIKVPVCAEEMTSIPKNEALDRAARRSKVSKDERKWEDAGGEEREGEKGMGVGEGRGKGAQEGNVGTRKGGG